MLIGHVGADPDVRTMPDNVTKVAQVRIATTKRGYTKQNGQQVPDKTTWHTCIFWQKLAETVQQYVHKGDKLYVEGEYESREFQDRNDPNVKRTVYEVRVSNMEMLTPRSAAPAPSPAPMPMAPPAAPGYGYGQNGHYGQNGYAQAAPAAPAPAAPAPAPVPPHYAAPQQGTIPFQQQPAAQPQAQQGAPVQTPPVQGWTENGDDLPF